AALLINPGIVVMGQEGTSRLASCGYRGWDIPVLEAAPLGTPVSCNFPAALISSEVCSALNVLISSVHAPSWAMAPGGHYETSSPKIFASGSGRYRPAHGLTLRLGAITPCGSGGTVRVATGLLAMWQSTAWLGAEAGLFKKRGIDMTLPAIAVGGPEAAAGLIRGDWEFAHTGSVPVAEEVLKVRDIVILAMPTSDFPKS